MVINGTDLTEQVYIDATQPSDGVGVLIYEYIKNNISRNKLSLLA